MGEGRRFHLLSMATSCPCLSKLQDKHLINAFSKPSISINIKLIPPSKNLEWWDQEEQKRRRSTREKQDRVEESHHCRAVQPLRETSRFSLPSASVICSCQLDPLLAYRRGEGIHSFLFYMFFGRIARFLPQRDTPPQARLTSKLFLAWSATRLGIPACPVFYVWFVIGSFRGKCVS